MSELPEGWQAEKLVNIAQRITKGSTPTSYGFKYQGSGIAFIKVENIKNGAIDRQTLKHFISEEANANQKRSILEAGDVLFSIAGTIGRICLVDYQDLPANTNQALAIIRGTDNVLVPVFLRHQLESEVARKQSNQKERGGGMNNLSLEDIANFDVYIPPLNEQYRIVAKLEKLLSRVDAAQARLATIPRILKRFRQSVLAAACSGRLTADWRKESRNNLSAESIVESLFEQRISEAETAAKADKLRAIYEHKEENDSEELPEGWKFIALGKLCESFDYGTSAKSQPSGLVPVLRMGNIQNGEIDWSDLVYTSDEDEIAKGASANYIR